MENSKMCNWGIISLGNTCVLANLQQVQSPSLPLLQKKGGSGGCLLQEGSPRLSPRCLDHISAALKGLGAAPARGRQPSRDSGGSAPREGCGDGQRQQLQTSLSPGSAPEALQARVANEVGCAMEEEYGLPQTPPRAASGAAGKGFLFILRAS